VTSPEEEPTEAWDSAEERTAHERQTHLTEAILHQAGAPNVATLVQPTEEDE